jgi:DNA-binding NtrC family response regulator
MIDGAPQVVEVLLVDDEEAWLRSLSMALGVSAGLRVRRCSDSRQVMDLLAEGTIRLVLLDLNMPNLSGEQLLPRIVEEHPEVPVIVISGLNQVETAVECMKRGAFDFFVKTVEHERLLQGVQRALRMVELQRENREMRSRVLDGRLRRPECFADIVTRDPAMTAALVYAEAVARSPQPVLVTGETGVGKELVARAIHLASGRRGKLVSMNVAGLDDAVFSDTLFGHVRGAFTGAEGVRSGMIEQAVDGTLFLDEIGDLSMPSQVKLLRLVQEGEYFALGSDVPKRMNARLVVATHCDLDARQKASQFRKDLYYRLRAHHVHVPALRERRDDVPVLLDHFLEEAARSLGKKKPTVPQELLILLANYPFPGNVRELRSMVFDAMSLHESRMLSMDAFKRATGSRSIQPAAAEGEARPRRVFVPGAPLPALHEVVDLLIEEALRRAEGKQTIASRLIGISQPALSKRLRNLHRRRGDPL